MGLFHDKCNAYVRVSDGSALTGAELESAERLAWTVDAQGHRTRVPAAELAAALAANGWGICGNRVSKRARICNMCGKGAPDGWIKCPACGRWVGNDSRYCANCNNPLHPADRIDLAGGVWDRDPDCYAQRFDLDDVRFIDKHGLQVQEGTSAILLDGGNEVKVLGAGLHQPTGTLRTLSWFGSPPPRSAVMVDSGDVVFRVEFKSEYAADGGSGGGNAPAIRSAEDLPVSAEAEITLRFVPSKAEGFMQNFMKDLRRVTAKDVCQWLYQEALSAVRTMCNMTRIEDLVGDPLRRERFEDAISQALREPLSRCGLELVRVGAVEFSGRDYEDMRDKYGVLEKQRRLFEYQKKQLGLVAEMEEASSLDTRRKAKLAQDTQEYLDQLAQEKGLSDIGRAKEMQIAVQVAQGEVSAEEAKQLLARQAEQHVFAMRELANQHELQLTQANFDRDELIRDAENKAKLAAIARTVKLDDEKLNTQIMGEKVTQAEMQDRIERLRIDRELWEAERWRELKEKIERDKFARKMDWAKVLRDFPQERVLALLDDPQQREDFLKFLKMQKEEEMLRIKAGMNEKQILAVNAGGENAANATANANALGRIAEAEENAARQRLDERRQVDAESNARADRAQQQMHEVAMEAVKHQNTVVVSPTPPVTNMQH